ncbi:MAG: hypothetical protein E6J45_05745 [Chloroflexi bacterium]|nr:MAG: hypothetical protein E6J45_05745 [Chloroflexota bacterium]
MTAFPRSPGFTAIDGSTSVLGCSSEATLVPYGIVDDWTSRMTTGPVTADAAMADAVRAPNEIADTAIVPLSHFTTGSPSRIGASA